MIMELFFIGINLLISLLIAGFFWIGHLIYFSNSNRINPSIELFLLNHEQGINVVLIPLFIIDFISLFFMLMISSLVISAGIIFLNLIFLFIAITLTQTFLLPALHRAIKNPKEDLRLSFYRYNWVRTIVWNLKTIFLIVILLEWIYIRYF